jgi:hypothetical protein
MLFPSSAAAAQSAAIQQHHYLHGPADELKVKGGKPESHSDAMSVSTIKPIRRTWSGAVRLFQHQVVLCLRATAADGLGRHACPTRAMELAQNPEHYY